MTALVCSRCGAALDPAPGAVRVACTYCKAVTEVVSEQAARLGQRLEGVGIRLPERPMTQADIAEELARRQREEDERLRTARLTAAVIAALALVAVAIGLVVR